jgi:hypothetical protein
MAGSCYNWVGLLIALPDVRRICYHSHTGWDISLTCVWRILVPKKKSKAAAEEERPRRRKLTAEESLQRMKEFDKRKEAFVAALRKSKDRGVSP